MRPAPNESSAGTPETAPAHPIWTAVQKCRDFIVEGVREVIHNNTLPEWVDRELEQKICADFREFQKSRAVAINEETASVASTKGVVQALLTENRMRGIGGQCDALRVILRSYEQYRVLETAEPQRAEALFRHFVDKLSLLPYLA
jgi:hypothetical protein